MFALILGGPIDAIAGALALGVMFVTICVFVVAYINKRRSRQEIDNDFQLAKIKQHDYTVSLDKKTQFDHEEALLRLDANKQIEFRKIETGLIEGKVNKPTDYDNGRN